MAHRLEGELSVSLASATALYCSYTALLMHASYHTRLLSMSVIYAQFIKNIGGRKALHSQSREIVYNVYKFMRREAKKGVISNMKQVQMRVSEATGV